MAFEHHKNVDKRFIQQVENSAAYIIPFIEKHHSLGDGTSVLEIGCGEGGVLSPFIDLGCQCLGVELAENKYESANKIYEEQIKEGKVKFINRNIYDESFLTEFKGQFDLIILKDVIEHLEDQEKMIGYLASFLKPGGMVFFGFPPWYMPFGGHQQVCKSKFLSILPYYHLLPMPLYKMMLRTFGEDDRRVEHLADIKRMGISIERFEGIVKRQKYDIVKRQQYLINPIYKYKFGFKPRKQNLLFGSIPFFRNFVSTCVYYLISPKK